MPSTRSKIHRVLIIIPDDALVFEATGLAEIFSQANVFASQKKINHVYEVRLAATQRHRVVHGRSGINVLADAFLGDLDPKDSLDTLIVTGRGSVDSMNFHIAAWIKVASKYVGRVVSVCTGAFHLAETGMLDGKRATTHWKAVDELKAKHPLIKVEHDAIYVRDGNIYTSAGASSGFDLGLALVEDDLGFEIARDVARFLVMYLRRPGGQSQFGQLITSQASQDGPMRDVQTWALEHIKEDLSIERLAERAAMSPRNFSRVFAKQTGQTPARFVETLRLELARQRLEQGTENLDQIAQAVGLGTSLNLRRIFERNLGIGPTDYRARFGMI